MNENLESEHSLTFESGIWIQILQLESVSTKYLYVNKYGTWLYCTVSDSGPNSYLPTFTTHLSTMESSHSIYDSMGDCSSKRWSNSWYTNKQRKILWIRTLIPFKTKEKKTVTKQSIILCQFAKLITIGHLTISIYLYTLRYQRGWNHCCAWSLSYSHWNQWKFLKDFSGSRIMAHHLKFIFLFKLLLSVPGSKTHLWCSQCRLLSQVLTLMMKKGDAWNWFRNA